MTTMTSIKRHEAIMEQLMAQGEATVAELAALLGVTGKTIRHDLEKLERQGWLRRIHGGARLAGKVRPGWPVPSQEARHANEKAEAAGTAVAMIERNDIIALDSGSTTLEIARQLDDMPLTVITNDLYIIAELIKKEQIRLVVPGGIRSRNMLVSEEPARWLSTLNVQKAFISTTGIHKEYGLTVFTPMHVQQKKALIDCAKHVFCVADHSKFDQCALMTFAQLGDIGEIITDSRLSDNVKREYEAAGVAIRTSKPAGSL